MAKSVKQRFEESMKPPVEPESVITAEAVAVLEPPADVTAPVAAMTTDPRTILDQATALLFAIAKSGRKERDVTGDEYVIFECLGWDRHRVEKEISRARNTLEWLGAAGTAAEREAAEDRQAAAKQALSTRGSEIQEQINALQAELSTLRTEANKATAVVEGHRQALVNIPKSLPGHMTRDIARREREVTTRMRTAAIGQKESRRNFLQAFLNPDPEDTSTAAQQSREIALRHVLNMSAEPFTVHSKHFARESGRLSGQFQAELQKLETEYARRGTTLTAQLQAELASLEAELQAFERDYHRALAEVSESMVKRFAK